MKKVLILMLVFGMTSLAGASFDLVGTDQGGGNYGMTVTSDGADPDAYWALGIDSGGSLSGVAIGPDAPSLSDNWGTFAYNGISGYFPGLTGYVGPFATAQGETRVGGTYLTGSAFTGSSAWVYMYSSPDTGTWTLEDSTFLPEPMTIALLGLGGLFLRRRIRRA